MEILGAMLKLLKPKTKASDPPITLDSEGFSLSGQNFPWSEIQEISAHKLDLFTTDEVRFVFTLRLGVIVEVSEEQPGFQELIDAATERFPSMAGWESRIILPAFKSNHSVLYRRT